ncbi:hypothetical protein GGF50DRAFT_120256 [Schizophyllum commune]
MSSKPSPTPSDILDAMRDRLLPDENGGPCFYDSVAVQIIAMGSDALANVDPTKHVVVREERGAVVFVHKDSGSSEFTVVGEAAGVEDGSALGAAGASRRPIYNSTAARMKVAMRDGTVATTNMAIVGNNQRSYVEEVLTLPTSADLHPPGSRVRVSTTVPLRLSEIAKKRWEKSRPGTGEPARDILVLTFPPLYKDLDKANDSTTSSLSARAPAARNVRTTVTAADIAENSGEVKLDPAEAESDEPKVGSLYPADLLPDHDQPGIHHTSSVRVEQHDIRDVDGNLIPPWELPSKLRPGTFFKALVTPTCWIFRTSDRVSKVYALVVKSLQVLDESNEGVQVQPKISDFTPAPSTPSTPKKRTISSSEAAFDSITTPSPKKRRMME